MKTLLLSLLFAVSAMAQSKITLTGSPVRAGASATLSVVLSGSAGVATATQWTITPAISGMVASTGIIGKSVVCQTVAGAYSCVVSGGITGIPDGTAATITFPAPTLPGPVTGVVLTLSGMLGVNAVADSPGIPIVSGPTFTLTVLSPCDLNSDGVVDTLDARNVIDQIEGVIPAVTDLNGDGKTNVIDLQRVVNATGGGSCRTGP